MEENILLVENNFKNLLHTYEFFVEEVKNKINKISEENHCSFLEVPLYKYLLSRDRGALEYNLLAAITFFFPAIDVFIGILYLFENYPDIDMKKFNKFDKQHYMEKLKWLSSLANEKIENLDEIGNIHSIYRNRFHHTSTLELIKVGEYMLPKHEANTPHSSWLIFHLQEVKECVESMASLNSKLLKDKNLRFIHKYTSSKISRIDNSNLLKIVTYYRKKDFRSFSKKINFLMGLIDWDNDILRKYHGIELNSGACRESLITGKSLNLNSDSIR